MGLLSAAGPTSCVVEPKDVVKLEDRLHYVLQPPLETIFAGGTLDFPFTPFPYQFEGVAFLYSRYAAILALFLKSSL